MLAEDWSKLLTEKELIADKGHDPMAYAVLALANGVMALAAALRDT